ncbi:hypothetical protein PGT21_003553 [Puccinia graminis f. sp. tritici]|uniref:Uncharacterized protein n=1 Tax=Puccinia graminis f. sp. tritici TaxID=56615 RepID=A0A5B0PP58_PUCGR|nr:hypothetical protein PGT21_003553 [Puccinia graminis f. sp. tritici]
MQMTQECNRSPTGNLWATSNPNVIDSVHDIAETLSGQNDTASDEAYFRQAVRNTTSSLVASNAGNQVNKPLSRISQSKTPDRA